MTPEDAQEWFSRGDRRNVTWTPTGGEPTDFVGYPAFPPEAGKIRVVETYPGPAGAGWEQMFMLPLDEIESQKIVEGQYPNCRPIWLQYRAIRCNPLQLAWA